MRDQEKICREEWFKDHVAKELFGETEHGQTTIIEWKKPTSWNYGCRFIIHSQWLIVVGDMGEAVYQWGQNLDLKFLGQINFDYFMGKCRASPAGTRFRQWDHEKAEKRLDEIKDKTPKAYKNLKDACCHPEEFKMALHEAIYYHDLDSEYASDLCEAGYIPDCMCVGHLVGLQMAIKQLTQPPNETT